MFFRSLHVGGAFVVIVLVSCLQPAAQEGGQEDMEKLIDELIEVTEPGFGYSVYFSGSEFLPYEGTEAVSTFVFGGMRATRSETLKKIVERGADAVPLLLKHIGDDRKLKMEPLSAMEWMEFSDEYDFNRRTREEPAEGVNRGLFDDDENQNEGDEVEGENAAERADQHALTVGDLCFVALGQIVNRGYSATRYQPSGGLVVNSPTHSKALRKAIIADWSGLTREKHKNLLIEDFLHPDSEDRRIGAYFRLALYYPETVEPLVLEELKKPTFDDFAIEEFCRNTLYTMADEAERRTRYDAFLREHGEVWAAGIQEQLFDDLELLEEFEQGVDFGTRPRELLIQLFGHPANVKSTDRPSAEMASETARASLINSLTHDDSRRIGDAVQRLFREAEDDADLRVACLRCLASRGYAEFVIEQLDTIDVSQIEINGAHVEYISAIAESKAPQVRERLLGLVRKTLNDAYFMAALPAIDREHDALILDRAKTILRGLPEDTDQGRDLLELIGERFPVDAREIYESFIANGSAQRAETMCVVLWYGNPLSKVILAPLLDDKRPLSGFSIPMRVCDRAAEAISQTSEAIEFDSEWGTERKDRQIEKLKEYCRKEAASSP